MMSPSPSLPLALTIGEPGGIGPDLAIQIWNERHSKTVPPFYCIADPDFIMQRAQILNIPIKIANIKPEETLQNFDQYFPIVPLEQTIDGTVGTLLSQNATAIIASITAAVKDVMDRRAIGVVTNPIHKKNLHDAGFQHPGHTEFLASLAQQHTGHQTHPVMLLHGPDLRIVPATIHIPLKEVPAHLTTNLIVKTARIIIGDLKRRFALPTPRLAITGLNPHAGEDGLFGNEEKDIIIPAIKTLQNEGFDINGPHPADSLFHAKARQNYDVALAMYHDQALIPAKTLAFERAVNVTLGLPFIRTSPDHGTALDLAGSGKANPESLLEALRLAAWLGKNESQRHGWT